MGWKRYFRRRYWDEERSREIKARLDLETDENIARGMPPEEARHAACRKFGNVTLIREEIYRMNTIGFIETLWQDLRHALRSLRRTPGFSAAAIVTLALGIGANTIIFGVVDAVFRPLPYRNPDQLVDIANVARRGTSLETRYFGMSRDTLAAWRAQKHTSRCFYLPGIIRSGLNRKLFSSNCWHG